MWFSLVKGLRKRDCLNRAEGEIGGEMASLCSSIAPAESVLSHRIFETPGKKLTHYCCQKFFDDNFFRWNVWKHTSLGCWLVAHWPYSCATWPRASIMLNLMFPPCACKLTQKTGWQPGWNHSQLVPQIYPFFYESVLNVIHAYTAKWRYWWHCSTPWTTKLSGREEIVLKPREEWVRSRGRQ